MFEVRFPLAIDDQGHLEQATYPAHVRQMLEQLLFTSPGERVNRPTFGVGLLERVFLPDDEATAAALRFDVSAAILQWLGDVVELRAVDVQASDAELLVTIVYALRQTGEVHEARFTR